MVVMEQSRCFSIRTLQESSYEKQYIPFKTVISKNKVRKRPLFSNLSFGKAIVQFEAIQKEKVV